MSSDTSMDDFFGRGGKRPTVATDTVVFTMKNEQLQILLVLRGHEPFKGKWALPGGFMEWSESCEQSAARELQEETGLEGLDLKFLGIFDRPGRDPRGTVVSVEYVTVLKNPDAIIKGGDDAAEAQWFPVQEHPPLAFDHEEVLQRGLDFLRDKNESMF